MWMVVNRLNQLDIKTHIKDGQMNLLSARHVYATECLHVYQDGRDTVCRYGEDYFILLDIECGEALEIVQCVFDCYNVWYGNIIEAAGQKNFEKIIRESRVFFGNPIILQDSNYKVISMSSDFGQNDYDEEIQQIKKYGYSSLKAIDYFEKLWNEEGYYSERSTAHYYTGKQNCMEWNFACIDIKFQGKKYGQLLILEDGLKINKGAMQLLEAMAKILAPGLRNEKNDNYSANDILVDWLKSGTVKYEVLEKQFSLYQWSTEDIYEIWRIGFDGKGNYNIFSEMVRDMLKQNNICCPVLIMQNGITIIINKSKTENRYIKKLLTELCSGNDALLSVSLSAKGFENLHHYYNQAIYAMEEGRKCGHEAAFFSFYDYAIKYIISIGFNSDMRYACNPNLLTLWEKDCYCHSESVYVLKKYLDNGKSFLNAANELYMHRNTLVYRIKKIQEIVTDDLSDPYVLDYIKLSIYILDLFSYDDIIKHAD